MVAMVELQINEPTNVPEWLFVMFAVCTTVLVAVHIFALMISTYLLPNIDAVSKMESPGSPARVLQDSPHERMRGFIELAWAFSTVLGKRFQPRIVSIRSYLLYRSTKSNTI